MLTIGRRVEALEEAIPLLQELLQDITRQFIEYKAHQEELQANTARAEEVQRRKERRRVR